MAMTIEIHLMRRFKRLALAIGLTLVGAGAFAQDAPLPASGVSYPEPTQAAARLRPDRIRPRPQRCRRPAATAAAKSVPISR
jgi:hypothetical protein